MKKTLSLLAITVCVAISGLQAQTADDIVNKHLEARGGADKLRSLTSLIQEAVMNQQGVDVNLKFYNKQNEASKTEYTAMGQTGFTILTPTKGWALNPFGGDGGVQELPEEALKDAPAQLDIQGPLLDYKKKGNTVEYLGQVTEQGAQYHKLKLTRANGRVTLYYFDDKFLTVKTVTIVTADGTDTEVVAEYSDYRKTPEGLVFAFKRINNGNEMTYEKIEVNPKIDESVFKPGN